MGLTATSTGPYIDMRDGLRYVRVSARMTARPEPAAKALADSAGSDPTPRGGHTTDTGHAARPTNAPGDVPARRTGGRHGPRCPITAPNTKTPPQR
jgi:hypothetical protein